MRGVNILPSMKHRACLKLITCLVIMLAMLSAVPVVLAKDGIRVVGPMGREYYLFVPEKIDLLKTYWLIVGVHGYRGNGKGGSGVAQWVARGDCIVVAPSFPNGFQLLEEQTDTQLLEIVAALQRQYKLHPKLFVTGHSGGSQFAHRFASKYPDKTLACVASSGGTWATGNEYGTFSTAAKNIPLAISCGEKDTGLTAPGAPMGRLAWAKKFETELAAGGFFYKAKYWPGAGHGGDGRGNEQLRVEAFSLGTSGLIGDAAKERDAALKKINALLDSGDFAAASSTMRTITEKMKQRSATQFATDLKANGWQGGASTAAECAQRCRQFWTEQSAELAARIAARNKPSPPLVQVPRPSVVTNAKTNPG